MRRPAALLAALCVVVVLAAALVSVAQRNALAFTIGVAPAFPVLELKPRETACQTPITVPVGGEFDRVELTLSGGQPGEVTIVDRNGKQLGRGELPAGAPNKAAHVVRVGEVAEEQLVGLCLRNSGSRTSTVYGNAEAAARFSYVLHNDEPEPVDIALRFERSARSDASLFGLIADRASLFKFGWMGGWTFWILGALVLLAVPALLVRALRGALE